MTNFPMNAVQLEALLADSAITAIYIDGQGVRYSKHGLTLMSEITLRTMHSDGR